MKENAFRQGLQVMMDFSKGVFTIDSIVVLLNKIQLNYNTCYRSFADKFVLYYNTQLSDPKKQLQP